MIVVATLILQMMHLILFALVLGLIVISFRAYKKRNSKRLESAFIGFAFIGMGVSLMVLVSQIPLESGSWLVYLRIVEVIPLIVGFSMLYLSLYR